jgi:uncharacterized protein DUF4178
VTKPGSNCPNCGAPVVFEWSSSVQTTCSYCHSILVRTDVDLQKVGTVADLPPDSSPIQLRTEGVYRNHSFMVAGRIVYEYDQGTWNEWHVVLNNGASAWLSDAQNQYAVTVLSNQANLPDKSSVQVGSRFTWNGVTYTATTITEAHYRGVEGELPFQYSGKQQSLFIDLQTANSAFATLDYSDPQPFLYIGESFAFEDLHLKNLRQFEGWS